MGDGGTANYDKGFYNISVRRSSEDVGRDDTAPGVPPQPPFQNPLDGKKAVPAVLRGAGASRASRTSCRR